MRKVIDYYGRLCGVNKRYINRRYNLTKEYREQHERLVLLCKVLGKCFMLKKDVYVTMYIHTSKDIDGVIKPVLDVLQEAEVYGNDRQVVSLSVRKIKIKRNQVERLEVWVGDDNT